MIRLVIASLFLHQVIGTPIAGGHICDILVHPWMASIQSNDYHDCAGSIISDTVILTAAHCVEEPEGTYIVRVGSSRTDSGGSWHKVVAKKMHEKYSNTRRFNITVNDVALIKVFPSMKLSKSVSPIALAKQGFTLSPGMDVTVAGWGSEEQGGGASLKLKSTNLRIIDSNACARSYGDYRGTSIGSNHMICASDNGTDTCSGDSGGPLIFGEVQVGIVFTGKGCGNPRFPGIYVDVAYYRDWIESNYQFL